MHLLGRCVCRTSGEEKAHKHKQIFPVTARAGRGSPDQVGGGGLPTGGQGSKVYVLCAEPKEHTFSSGYLAGRNRVPGREDR